MVSTIAVGRRLTCFAALLVLGGEAGRPLAQERHETIRRCANLITDDEARTLGETIAKAAPRRQFKRKDVVPKKIGVDPIRLCNRRQGGANLGYKICWQISPSYDLTWWQSAFDGPADDRDDRRIYSVGVMQRPPGWLGSQCSMTDEERGVTKRRTRK
jgi:hypothetical protein